MRPKIRRITMNKSRSKLPSVVGSMDQLCIYFSPRDSILQTQKLSDVDEELNRFQHKISFSPRVSKGSVLI